MYKLPEFKPCISALLNFELKHQRIGTIETSHFFQQNRSNFYFIFQHKLQGHYGLGTSLILLAIQSTLGLESEHNSLFGGGVGVIQNLDVRFSDKSPSSVEFSDKLKNPFVLSVEPSNSVEISNKLANSFGDSDNFRNPFELLDSSTNRFFLSDYTFSINLIPFLLLLKVAFILGETFNLKVNKQ